MTLEKKIERRMCDLIKKRGGLTFKFTSPNCPGVPDRIVITAAGVVWFVELKSRSGRMSKLQQYQISVLKKQGVNVRVIRGWDAAQQFVEEIVGNEIRDGGCCDGGI